MESPLVLSSREGHIEIVRALIHAKATVNREEKSAPASPLMASCSAGNLDVMRELIQAREV